MNSAHSDDRNANATIIGRPLLRRDVVASTMDELAALAYGGAQEGTVLVADFQTAGRGRGDHDWEAPPGSSLLLSVLLRPPLPPDELTPLSLLTAGCVAEAIEETIGLRAAIKWPNDLLIGERKLCGILLRLTSHPAQRSVAILGIGLNVNTPADLLPPGATSLRAESGELIDREGLLGALLRELDGMYGAFANRDYADWWARALARLAFVGETVLVRDGDRSIIGALVGVEPNGALTIREQGGVVRSLVAGELVRGPRRLRQDDLTPL